MSRTIRVTNNQTEYAEKTYLSEAVSLGGTTLPIRNTDGFSASWGIQVGDSGEEKSEVLVLGTATPSGTALYTTGTVRFDHPTDTPVYAIKYDQLVFKKSTSGTSGTAVAITDGTITLTPGGSTTDFDDTAGGVADAYRVARYSSVLTSITDDSDWLTDTGYDFYSLASMRKRTKNRLFSDKYISNDSLIDDWTNEWLEQMNNVAVDVNKDYLLGTTSVAFGTNGLGTITASDFKDIRRIWFTTNGSDYYTASKTDIISFDESDMSLYSNTLPEYYMYGDDVFGKLPTGDSGTASIVYASRVSKLTDDTDTLPVSMRNYTKSFIDYNVAQAYYMDEKPAMGDRFIALANTAKENFRSEISARSKTGITFISTDYPLTGDDGSPWF